MAHNRELAEQERTKGNHGKRMTKDAFRRGLLLLNWIRSDRHGKLTKALCATIRTHCPDRPEVKKSGEKRHSALKSLADRTRRARQAKRLPAGWLKS
jgi:hypothetical protein